MQGSSEALRSDLWDRLKPVFQKYADKATGEIAITRVQEIVTDVLHQTTQEEINYVMKNMFRLDADNSGTVDFLEFGNFLFKRHCGEMSLQKTHKAGKMKHGSERKILPEEFWKLINQAFTFLHAEMKRDISDQIFKDCDKDKDGKITYVEYFQFIDKYICFTGSQFANYSHEPEKVVAVVEVKQDLGRQWNGRLRAYLWLQLRKLYDAFIQNRSLAINDDNVRKLLHAILGTLSEEQESFLLSHLFTLTEKYLEFVPFAIKFLYIIAELGLIRYAENHPSNQKALNQDEFIILLRNTFKFLNIIRVKTSLLMLIFAKIDTNHDGLITFDQYLRWLKFYLAVQMNRGEQYYLKEDDDSIGGDIFDEEKNFEKMAIKPVQTKKNLSQVRFIFTDYGLSGRVRKRVLELLIPFDANKDKLFQESQIKQALVTLLKENEYQIPYVTRNVFRYDRDGDNCVTYDELTDFCVEQHFGQMAIQRLHRKKSYSKGHERIMNEAEFIFTLNHALGFIKMQATEQQAKTIFRDIDLDKSGWITYEVYFLFLKYYFGTLRAQGQMVAKVEEVDPDLEWLNSLRNLSAMDRFIRMLLDQLRHIFMKYDYNKNLEFETDEIEAILIHVFGLDETEVAYILGQFFNFESKRGKGLQFEELVRILLQIYFLEIFLKRYFPNVSLDQWRTRNFTLEEFISFMIEGCYFLRKKPYPEDLRAIYQIIDTNRNGVVEFSEFTVFIQKYLGVGVKAIQPPAKPVSTSVGKPKDISEEEWGFINAIWSELKIYFDKYDTNNKGFLDDQDLKRFVIQVLKETSSRELDYVFWNLFRTDPNGDCSIEFHEFAPFILNHAGEIALQRFHKEQIKGKSNLTLPELTIVLSNGYSFLSTISKQKDAIKAIYTRAGKGSDPNYGAYLGWINRALAKKFA